MLVLVVGPSGAGKDTLLDGARRQLSGDRRFRFVRRIITRPANAGGEDHEAVMPEEFARRDVALSWRAHGFTYGIPADIADDIAKGVVAVANVSRTVIAQAAQRFAVTVVEVTAPADILAARMVARAREHGTEIQARLSRRVSLPAGVPSERVLNDGSIASGVARLVEIISRVAEPARQ
jgi:phosphonate metabolism protein PhnN/1,5-bisphosphokinase (PRPP-forming)